MVVAGDVVVEIDAALPGVLLGGAGAPPPHLCASWLAIPSSDPAEAGKI